MRVSPAPPPQSAPSSHHHLLHPHHSPHITPAVGGPSCSSSSGGLTSAPGHSSSVGDARNSPTMHAPPYPPNGPPHAPPPHGYPSKMGGHMSPAGLPYPQPGAYQQPGGLQYPGARPQGSSMHPFPQNFPPGGPQPPQGPPSSIPPSHQYPPRPPHSNHGPPSQYSPYPHYSAQQAWGPSMGQGPPPSSVLGSPGLGGKNQHPGQPVQPGGGAAGLPRPHTPPHYLKQHLHQKMGVYGPPPGAPPSAGGPPQMYPNGPGLPPGLGGGVRESSPGVGMVGAPAPHGGQNNAMPPPTSTPGPNEMELSNASAPSNLSSGNNALSQQQPPPPIGPDGNPLLDDASQQSTLSNTSAASGDDRSLTPKPHKDGPVPSNMTSMMSGGNMMGPGGPMGVQSSMTYGSSSHGGPPMNSSHPLNPHSHHQSSAPSPGSQPPEQGEYEGNVNSPGWPRSPSTQQAPSSAYGNSSTPAAPDIYRPSKADNIARLYEMSDSPERRQWLDKLLQFMEENKTPIAACPTISKNPLDLYALYLHVKERGGFMEVTKNKQWKDVAAVMGIGASSSGSYTLRKHYMKHILSYECRFDRGGIDPQPIISQIEASAKKKSSKPVSVPSPGSSNSQDSFPPAGSNNSSMDGYSNGPPHPGMPPYTPYPPSSDYPGHMQQRPPSQSQPGYQGYQGNQYPGYQGMHSSYSQGGYPPSSGYPPDSRGYQGGPPPPGPPNHQGSYQGYQQPGYQRGAGYPPPGQPGYQQEQYPKPGGAGSPGPPGQGVGPPNSQPYQGPRRHPDFEKQGPSPAGQQPPPGWRASGQQYPGYGGQGSQPSGPPQQPWSRPNDGSGPPPPPGAPSAPWPANRYPTPPSPASTQSFTNQGRWSGGSFTTGPPARPSGPNSSKSFAVPPPTSFKSSGYGAYMGKQLFPVDSVEAVLPVLPRRKRMTRHNLSPVNPWTLLMSLRCGLAAEVTWALDVMNILLFDDQTVVYFHLLHMPGLLDCLLEHWRRGLINMFSICEDLEPEYDSSDQRRSAKRIKADDKSDLPWYARCPRSPSPDVDITPVESVNPKDKTVILTTGTDYTMISKTGKPVKIVKREADQFIRDAMRGDVLMNSADGLEDDLNVSTSDFLVIGRTESTSHIICSMESGVPPLPFTRLIAGPGNDLEFSEKSKKNSVPHKPKDSPASCPENCRKFTDIAPKSEPNIDAEDSTVKGEEESSNSKKVAESLPAVTVATATPSSTTTTPSAIPQSLSVAEPVTNETKRELDDLLSKSPLKVPEVSSQISKDSCNGPKELTNNIYSSLKFNRSNKTSKLDAILKRIKKEPVENAVELLKASDAKSQLDMLVGQVSEHQSLPSATEEKSKPSDLPFTALNCKKDQDQQNQIVETADQGSVKTSPIEKDVEPNLEKPIASTEECKQEVNLDSKTPKLVEEKEEAKTKDAAENSNVFVVNKKRPVQEVEEESWSPDEASLCVTSEAKDWLARRVLCLGTVLRNLSFIPGNDEIMGKNPAMMALLGRTILLHHEHPSRAPSTPHYDREDDADLSDWCSSLSNDVHWWWPYLHHLHEACLVTLCNISGHLDLSQYPEEITRPIVSGLLHWATCPASYGQDPLPSGGGSAQSALSPQRLALEALVKLCVQDQNTDLVLATPPFSRLERLCSQLTRMLCRGEDQVLREFSINLLHYFAAAESGVARLVAMQNGSVSLLVAFIEEAESAAMNVANSQGVSALKENPDLMGTSLDMVRRAANTLVHLSKVSENSRILATCENRLLTLVMSQILDTYVASQLSQVLYNMAHVKSEYSPDSPSPKDTRETEEMEVTPAVVPPASLFSPNTTPQETPVLVAALSDYTSQHSNNGSIESSVTTSISDTANSETCSTASLSSCTGLTAASTSTVTTITTATVSPSTCNSADGSSDAKSERTEKSPISNSTAEASTNAVHSPLATNGSTADSKPSHLPEPPSANGASPPHEPMDVDEPNDRLKPENNSNECSENAEDVKVQAVSASTSVNSVIDGNSIGLKCPLPMIDTNFLPSTNHADKNSVETNDLCGLTSTHHDGDTRQKMLKPPLSTDKLCTSENSSHSDKSEKSSTPEEHCKARSSSVNCSSLGSSGPERNFYLAKEKNEAGNVPVAPKGIEAVARSLTNAAANKSLKEPPSNVAETSTKVNTEDDTLLPRPLNCDSVSKSGTVLPNDTAMAPSS
ncbi:trithorax group protein osa [Hyalella azteca]|uniref:Trithorax group protein osa n=2 Tax=Hyalella azteca TaxID=294128 RepID=A0A8B7PFC5_HYAAZ|nr:trithorax group protein osa [Hyalella azteca]